MSELDDFQRIIILKCLRPDKVTDAMQDYVARHLGQRFIEPQVIILLAFIYQTKNKSKKKTEPYSYILNFFDQISRDIN